MCLVLVLGTAACVPAGPQEVLESYATSFGEGNVDALVAMFAPFAVVTGHPLDPSELSGLDAIRRLEEQSLAWARAEDPIRFLDIRLLEDGVTFDQVIHGADGSCIGGGGNRIVVDTGKIIRWEWGSRPVPCD